MNVYQLVVDVDDVLFDSTCWDRWLHKFLVRFGVVGTYVGHAKVWGIDYLPAVYRGEVDYWDALFTYLRSMGLTTGQAEELIAASRMKRKSLIESKRMYPNARTGLFRMSAIMPVTLVANTLQTGDQMATFLKRFGLSENMFSVVTSRDTGHAISEPGFFEHLLATISPASRENVGMVSASQMTLAQASRKGLHPIAIAAEKNCEIECRFESFEQAAIEMYTERPQLRRAA